MAAAPRQSYRHALSPRARVYTDGQISRCLALARTERARARESERPSERRAAGRIEIDCLRCCGASLPCFFTLTIVALSAAMLTTFERARERRGYACRLNISPRASAQNLASVVITSVEQHLGHNQHHSLRPWSSPSLPRVRVSCVHLPKRAYTRSKKPSSLPQFLSRGPRACERGSLRRFRVAFCAGCARRRHRFLAGVKMPKAIKVRASRVSAICACASPCVSQSGRAAHAKTEWHTHQGAHGPHNQQRKSPRAFAFPCSSPDLRGIRKTPVC